ncbi:MAG: hypothetical protein HY722_05565 [Planctomycetes bacterium]|nr:hypothetical protein [Planctomycetota bacterium]
MTMAPGLRSWLDAAAAVLTAQAAKIEVFAREQIYCEYWVQNELAVSLPWNQPGWYFVDRGPGISVPGDDAKYPDFVLRFGNASTDPVYWLELKDLVTNPSENAGALLAAMETMRRGDRVATIDRWKEAHRSKARGAPAFAAAIGGASFHGGGIALGPDLAIPATPPWASVHRWPVAGRWTLALFLGDAMLVGAGRSRGEAHEGTRGEPGPRPSPPPDPAPTASTDREGSALEVAIQIALAVESDRQARGVPVRFASRGEADRFKHAVETGLAEHNRAATPGVCHAYPWTWTPDSGGRPLTDSGRAHGVELRMSYSSKPRR